MKRILMLLSVVVLMVVMLAMSVATAWAVPKGKWDCTLPDGTVLANLSWGQYNKLSPDFPGGTGCSRVPGT
jgi:hypothetical protein